ncbi:MAG: hypothetical protein JO165_06070 [Candidatus Eremiobacteraeota bacterium]|nr:hypothetical protein [Candidatus Eremiobacteraeota bacterium]
MLLLFAHAVLVATLGSPSHTKPLDFSLTAPQIALVATGAAPISRRYASPSEAAYAAARAYRFEAKDAPAEIAAKIFMDETPGKTPLFGYGPEIIGTYDPFTSLQYVTYNLDEIDDRYMVVGMWHAHPRGDGWDTLFGHEAYVAQTHLAIWTTIGGDFYVQFWDGTRVAPQWNDRAVPPLAALCRACIS